MYGVLYAVSPEVFPAKDRGTGNGLTSTASRLFGLAVSALSLSHAIAEYWSPQGPIIALYAEITTSVPVYIAAAMIMGAGGIALLLPYEPRGKASM